MSPVIGVQLRTDTKKYCNFSAVFQSVIAVNSC